MNKRLNRVHGLAFNCQRNFETYMYQYDTIRKIFKNMMYEEIQISDTMCDLNPSHRTKYYMVLNAWNMKFMKSAPLCLLAPKNTDCV